MKVHAFFKIERLMLVMIVDDSVHVVHYSVNVVDDDCILFVDDSVTFSVVDGNQSIVFFLLMIVSLSVLLMVMSGFSFTLDVQMFLQMSFANVFNLSHFDKPSSDHYSSSLV